MYRRVPFESIQSGLASIRWPWLLGYLFLSLAEPVPRGFRWRELTGGRDLITNLKAVYIAKATNNLLPFRAGDAIRAQYSRDLARVSYSRSVASLFAEMAMDCFLLCLLGICFAVASSDTDSVMIAGFAAGLLAVGVLTILLTFRRRARTNQLEGGIRGFIHKMLRHSTSILAGSPGRRAAAWSLAIWVHAVAASYFGLRICLPSISLPGLLSSIVFVYFSVLVPSAPGFMGTYHAAIAGSMAIMGYNLMEYPLVPVLIHGLQFIPQTAIGLVAGLRYIVRNDWQEALSSLKTARASLGRTGL